jgi:hypothetical protein
MLAQNFMSHLQLALRLMRFVHNLLSDIIKPYQFSYETREFGIRNDVVSATIIHDQAR